MDGVDVTVIIPTYNRARFLPDALHSVLCQTRTPRQVIVVDDGSSDDTSTVVDAYRDRLIYLQKPNGGKSSALNFAMPHVAGSLVWIFDDDDIADPEALRHLVGALHARPDAGFSFGAFRHMFVAEDGSTREGPLIEFDSTSQNAIFQELLLGC